LCHSLVRFVQYSAKKKCTRVRRNEDAISIKAGLIKTIENTKSCSDKQNSF